MAVYNTLSGNKLRIDKASNTFINGKCVNPLANSGVTIAQRSLDEICAEPVHLEQLRITGHVPNFEYGHTKDENGQLVCKTVKTGQMAW